MLYSSIEMPVIQMYILDTCIHTVCFSLHEVLSLPPSLSLPLSLFVVQVIDGFCVHRTTDVRESVSYLTLLTRQLQRHYSVSCVCVCVCVCSVV